MCFHKRVQIFIILFNSIFILVSIPCYSQPGQWTWMHGSNAANSSGHYGVQGVPAPNNTPPALYEPCEWTDLNGNFWLYGGYEAHVGESDVLWKYDPLTNEWTWISGPHTLGDPGNFGIKGVASPTNHPPCLGWGIKSWTDLNGDLWMYGGSHISAQNMSGDLWKYNIASNMWTWMKGPGIYNQVGVYGIRTVPDTANYPPYMIENSTAWTDKIGNLWLFGGAPTFNQLWRYNIASNTWTWMKGPNSGMGTGNWGIKGVEDSLNLPSGRWVYAHWVDSIGNFWMFGGQGFDGNGITFDLQDLWKYNPLTNNWTWVNGSNIGALSTGHYGTRCVSDSLNQPPGRFESRTGMKDSHGDFWMFGGGNLGNNEYGDLWKYCVATNTWTWISGDTVVNTTGNYGVKGVSSPTNKPPSKFGGVGWCDNNWHIFIFGGQRNANPNLYNYNDLWRFEIDTTCAPCSQSGQAPQPNFTVNNSSFCEGTCVNFTNLSHYASSYQWSFPGGIPSSDTTANPSPVCYFNSGNYSVTLTTANSFGSNSVTTNNMITVFPNVQFSPIVHIGDTLFSVPGFSSYQWYHGTTLIQSATNYYYVMTQSGDYTIQVTDSNGCSASATLIGVVTSVKENIIKQINFDAHYNSGNIYINYLPKTLSLMLIEIYNATGQKIYSVSTNVDPGKNEILLQGMKLTKGIYFVKIYDDKVAGVKEIIVE